MKHAFFLISFLFLFQTSNAQLFTKEKVAYDANSGRGSTDNNLLRWGYFLGFNNYDFNFDYNKDLRDIFVKRSVGHLCLMIVSRRVSFFVLCFGFRILICLSLLFRHRK